MKSKRVNSFDNSHFIRDECVGAFFSLKNYSQPIHPTLTLTPTMDKIYFVLLLN